MQKAMGILTCAAAMAIALSVINTVTHAPTAALFGMAGMLYAVIGATVGLIVSRVGHSRPVITATITTVALWLVYVLVAVQGFGALTFDVARVVEDAVILGAVGALGGLGYKLAASGANPHEDNNA